MRYTRRLDFGIEQHRVRRHVRRLSMVLWFAAGAVVGFVASIAMGPKG